MKKRKREKSRNRREKRYSPLDSITPNTTFVVSIFVLFFVLVPHQTTPYYRSILYPRHTPQNTIDHRKLFLSMKFLNSTKNGHHLEDHWGKMGHGRGSQKKKEWMSCMNWNTTPPQHSKCR